MILIVFFLLLIAMPAQAATYWVHPSGNNGACTNTTTPQGAGGNAKTTIQAGIACLGVGDTLMVRGGTYNELIYGFWFDGKAGTSFSNMTRVVAATGETVNVGLGGNQGLSFTEPGVGKIVRFINLHGLHINGNVAVGGGGNGGEVDHIKISGDLPSTLNCEITGSSQTGIFPGHNGWITGCSIHDNGTNDFDHGIYAGYEGGVFEYNDIYNNAGWGVHVYNGADLTAAHSTIVRFNRVHNNARVGNRGHGIMFSSGANNVAYGNLVYNNTGPFSAGLNTYDGASNSQFYNNTVYGNTIGVSIDGSVSNITVRNNIFYNNGTNTQYAGATQSNNLTANPSFASTTPGNANFLKLTSASTNAIDQGQNLGTIYGTDFAGVPRPGSGPWEIGAFEFVGAGPPPTDNFARANGSLGSNWLSGYTGWSPGTIVGEQVQGTVLSNNGMQVWSTPATPNHTGTVTLSTYGANGDVGIIVRASAPPTRTAYYIAASAGNPSSTYIYRCVSGGSCTAVEDNSVTWAQGDTLKVSAVGAVISVYRNDSFVFSYTDPSPLTGTYVGFGSFAGTSLASMAADNFIIESLGGTTPPPSAPTWYVNNTHGKASDSNACTDEGLPCSTIQGALSKVGYGAGAGAGKVVEVITGTYTPNVRIGGSGGGSWPTGTSWSAPFQLRCRAGATCTVRGTAENNIYISPAGNYYLIIGGDNSAAGTNYAGVTVTAPGGGFTFDGSNTAYTQFNTDDPSSVAIIGNTFINTENGNGIFLGTGSDFIVRGNTMHGGAFSAPSNDAKLGHAIYAVSLNSLFERNVIYDMQMVGIHIASTNHIPTPINNTIRYNVVHDFSLGTCCGAGIIAFANNSFGEQTSNTKIYGNIVYNGTYGISASSGSLDTQIYNNTIYNMSQIAIDAVNSTGTIARNNIISQAGQPGRLGSSSTFNTNLCNSLQTGNPIGCSVIEATPANIFTTPGSDFHLKAGSPAINQGANLGAAFSPDFSGTPRPTSGAWDLGAYEEGTGVGPPPFTCPAVTNSLVASYGFEGSGADATGNGHVAVLGPGWSYTGSGKYGQGAVSTGVSGITVADHDALDPCAAFTYEGWINIPSTAANYVFINKNPESKAYLFASIFAFCASGSGVPIGGYTQPTNVAACYATPLSTGFQHLAITYDASLGSDNLKLYLNGTPVAVANGTELLTPTTGTLQFCESSFGEICPSGTVIDNIHVYNYARSAAQIVADRDAPIGSLAAPTLKLSSGMKFGASASAMKVR